MLNIRNNGKYNQAKALNLKLEYGFRPLPPRKGFSGHLFSSMDNTDIDNINNSIENQNLNSDENQTNGSMDDDNISSHGNDNNDNKESIYQSLLYNRTMKSIESLGNHLDELSSTDYKKYISYPLETESSDIHRLAFTGIESFRPDHHSNFGMIFDKNYGLLNTISNYPNIKNFKKQGIDCARSSGYCEYDSSYPM